MLLFCYFLIIGIIIQLIVEYWWIVLIVIGISLIVSVIIEIIIHLIIISFSEHYYSDSSDNQNSCSSSDCSRAISCFYSGSVTSGKVTGSYRDGKIFSGYDSVSSFSSIIASYCNGLVYDESCNQVEERVIGRYENGRIYKGCSILPSDLVGTYKNGFVYSAISSSKIIGRYTGNDEGGAASAIYFLFN